MNTDPLCVAFEAIKAQGKDYPASWRHLIAADACAISLYYCRAIAHHLPARPWDELGDEARSLFRLQAHRVLAAMQRESGSDLSQQLFELGVAMNRAMAMGLHESSKEDAS